MSHRDDYWCDVVMVGDLCLGLYEIFSSFLLTFCVHIIVRSSGPL